MGIDEILKELKGLNDKRTPYIPTTSKLSNGQVSLTDCCDKDGNLPLLPDGNYDTEAMVKNYLITLGIDPAYCCDEKGELPRLKNGGYDLVAIRERAYEKMESELSTGRFPLKN